ncbi:DUF6130 family protein [Massilia niastensis]|uniref:DUF6130 family protein n=1 Tax=Massilia niastensis TaxID=544911 RepID=UPI000366B2BC|nr:DUF6130 family protein [Massilia niastensis]
MSMSLKQLAAAGALVLVSAGAWAQSPDSQRPPAVLPLASEAPPKVIAYAPVPEALARGVIIIQHRTENARLMPVFGPKAAEVTPRINHLHVSVDDQPMRWAHTSTDPIIVVGLKPGKHTILLELADPTHKILTSERVTVTVPEVKAAGHQGH